MSNDENDKMDMDMDGVFICFLMALFGWFYWVIRLWGLIIGESEPFSEFDVIALVSMLYGTIITSQYLNGSQE